MLAIEVLVHQVDMTLVTRMCADRSKDRLIMSGMREMFVSMRTQSLLLCHNTRLMMQSNGGVVERILSSPRLGIRLMQTLPDSPRYRPKTITSSLSSGAVNPLHLNRLDRRIYLVLIS